MTPPDDPTDDEIIAVLRSLERSGTPPTGSRQRLREKVLAEYDGSARSNGVGERPGGDGADVLDLAELSSDSIERHRTNRTTWLLVAAAVLIAVTTVAQLVARTTTEAERILEVADRDAGPVRLAPGSYRTDVLGLTVGFDVLDELWAIEERPGIVTLSSDPTSSSGSTIWLLRPTGTSAELGAPTLEEAFGTDDARFSAQRTPTKIAGKEATSWIVTVSNAGAEAGDCTDGETCLALFDRPEDVGLQSPGANTVIEIPVIDGAPVVILVAGPNGGIDRATQDLLASLELEAP